MKLKINLWIKSGLGILFLLALMGCGQIAKSEVSTTTENTVPSISTQGVRYPIPIDCGRDYIDIDPYSYYVDLYCPHTYLVRKNITLNTSSAMYKSLFGVLPNTSNYFGAGEAIDISSQDGGSVEIYQNAVFDAVVQNYNDFFPL